MDIANYTRKFVTSISLLFNCQRKVHFEKAGFFNCSLKSPSVPTETELSNPQGSFLRNVLSVKVVYLQSSD